MTRAGPRLSIPPPRDAARAMTTRNENPPDALGARRGYPKQSCTQSGRARPSAPGRRDQLIAIFRGLIDSDFGNVTRITPSRSSAFTLSASKVLSCDSVRLKSASGVSR